MNVAMTYREAALLEAFLEPSRHYLEFGSGGSTYLAAKSVTTRIISVDSSIAWLNSVRSKISPIKRTEQLILHHVDIGKIAEWGYPADSSQKETWPNYSTSVWSEEGADESDLYLIDGRFRIACFAETLVRSQIGSIIIIHDFENRPHYHVLKGLARCIAKVENLSAFVKDNTTNVYEAANLANSHRLDAR